MLPVIYSVPHALPLAVCVLDVQPHDVHGDVVLVEVVVYVPDVLLVIVVPAALVVRQREQLQRATSCVNKKVIIRLNNIIAVDAFRFRLSQCFSNLINLFGLLPTFQLKIFSAPTLRNTGLSFIYYYRCRCLRLPSTFYVLLWLSLPAASV